MRRRTRAQQAKRVLRDNARRERPSPLIELPRKVLGLTSTDLLVGFGAAFTSRAMRERVPSEEEKRANKRAAKKLRKVRDALKRNVLDVEKEATG